MSEMLGKRDTRKAMLKEMIRRLHDGADPERIKQQFQGILAETDSSEIAAIEDELVKEGMPREEIRRLCHVHLAVMQDVLAKEKTLAPPGHPIHTLMQEHQSMLGFAGDLKTVAGKVGAESGVDGVGEELAQLQHIAEHFREAERHYLREENVLFPYVEKHGITEPPAIMWMEHDQIREFKKTLFRLSDSYRELAFTDFARGLQALAAPFADFLQSHFFKEDNVLYPMAMRVIVPDEWEEISREFDEIGYCCFTPESVRTRKASEAAAAQAGGAEMISFDTGMLSREELETMLNNLPVDISFVDKDDKLRYFSQPKDRIFVRTKASIGRTVQACHPQKSLHVVQRIIDDFRQGTRDAAEFWINLEGKLVHIRYFALHDAHRQYMGCLEVVQDITEVKKVEGERRLLS